MLEKMTLPSFRKSGRYFRLLEIDPNHYFYTLDELCELLENGKFRHLTWKVVIYDRLSHKTQAEKRNAEVRRERIERMVKAKGFEVIGYYCETINGRSQYLEDRTELRKAVELAKTQKAILVFPSAARACRPEEFHPQDNPDAPLLQRDLDRFEAMTYFGRVAVAIIFLSERGPFTALGQAGRDKHGGRPRKKPPGYLKQRQKKYLPEVIRCHKREMSYRAIAAHLKAIDGVVICHTTIGCWIRRYLKQKRKKPPKPESHRRN